MVTLTKESTFQELGNEAFELEGHTGGIICRALSSAQNQNYLTEHNRHKLGDLLTPGGEMALFGLQGLGRQSITALHSFLFERGFSPDWPSTENRLDEPASRISRRHNLTDALEEADQQYAAKTGKPVGDFSKKIEENIRAQERGARLKGRNTL